MNPITPQQLAISGREDSEQTALFCWVALNLQAYPDLKWLFHVPNGGQRSKREGGKFKAMGVKPGVPDLFLPIKKGHWSGLWIELKRQKFKNTKSGGISAPQNEWIEHLQSQGFGAIVCYGWEEVRDVLIQYLEWRG